MPFQGEIVLVGLGVTTATALEALVERFRVAALVRPTDDAVVERAREAGIAIETDVSLAGIRSVVERYRPSAVVVSSYDRILPAALLRACPFVNVHYAALPRYRGRASVNWAIINGESETAITIHRLEPDLDAGGILYQEPVPIGPRDTVSDLYDRLNDIQRRRLATAVAELLLGDPGRPQDEAAASYGCTRLPADGLIDWTASAVQIDRLVRGLGGPFPPAFTFLGLKKLEIHAARPSPDRRRFEGRICGRVARIDAASGEVDVLAGDGLLSLQQIGFAGARPMSAASVIRSVRTTLGLNLLELVGLSAQRPPQADFAPELPPTWRQSS